MFNDPFPIEVSWALSELGLPKITKSHKIEKINIIGSLFTLAVISYSLTMIIYWLQYYIKITKTTLVL